MRPLYQILAGETALSGWLDRRRVELRLNQHVHDLLPPTLRHYIRVSDGNPPTLVLIAGSGAAGGIMRHRAPELLQRLQADGMEFTGIKVRVQARPAVEVAQKIPLKHRDRPQATILSALAATIEDPALKAALLRLAGREGAPESEGHKQSLECVEDQDPKQ